MSSRAKGPKDQCERHGNWYNQRAAGLTWRGVCTVHPCFEEAEAVIDEALRNAADRKAPLIPGDSTPEAVVRILRTACPLLATERV